MSDWFKEWFDTSFYETLYAHRDAEEASLMAGLIQSVYPPETYSETLDLACGRGRHSFNLSRLGYRVTGIDLSENAIRKANENIPSNIGPPPRFFVHDMRRPLNESFDLIVNLFTSFGYFTSDEENADVLKNIAGMLRENGAFVIDYLNPKQVEANLIPEETHILDDYTVKINRLIKDGMVHKIMEFTKDDSSAVQRFTERVKLYELDWFRANLSEAGLKTDQVYGHYNGEHFDESKSPRTIIFGRKSF